MEDIKKFIKIIFFSAIALGILLIGVYFFEGRKVIDNPQKIATGDVGCDNSKTSTTTATSVDFGVCPVKKPN